MHQISFLRAKILMKVIIFLIPLAIRLRIQTVKYINVGPFTFFLCIAVCNFFFLLHKTNNRMLALVQFSFVCILETE